MNKRALGVAVFALLLPCSGTAHAATGTELINAAQSFVQTGLSNAAAGFAPLRGAAIKESPGEHYQVQPSFGQFLPDCHISGYQPPQVRLAEWVFSCSSPGLGADPKVLRSLIYQGVVRALPACFTRTLDPAMLRDELFRWDCYSPDHSISVDVSSSPTSNGDPSFLLEVYEYIGAPPPPPMPAPSPTPVVLQLLKPQGALTMAGVEVPYNDYATLSFAVQTAISGGANPIVPRVVESIKGGNEMPAFDWAWHYAGKQTQAGVQTIAVWICGNLSPVEKTSALKQATLLGLLDSGQGGAVLQKAYAAARDADTALGSQAPDPFLNRRKLIYAMAPFFQ